MGNPVRILHLEDDAADVELIQAMLEAADMSCTTTVVQTRDQYSDALNGEPYDVILADYRLPAYDGLSALRLAREVCPGVPFIFVSGTLGEDPAIEALTEGATDYVLKQKLSRLAPAINRALAEAENRRERRRAEEALRESEEKYRILFEMESDALLLMEAVTGRILDANRACTALYGYSRDELCRMNIADLSNEPEKTREAVERRVRHVPLRYHRKKDGTVFPVESVASNLEWKGQEVRIAATRDITERNRMENVLRESEERFRTLAEKSLVGVYIIQDGLFRYINPASAEMLGYTVDEIMDRLGPADLLAEEDRERVLDSIRLRTMGEMVSDHLEFHVRRKDGVFRLVEAFGSRALHQGRYAVLGTLIDITERKASEERLFQATKRWEQTFDAVPDLIAILDNDYRIVQTNKAMAARMGLTPEGCSGQVCYKAVHGTDAPPSFCPHARSLRDGKEHMVEVSEPRLGGDFIVSTSPIFDSHGQMIGSVHVARDITERKKAETALRTSQLQLTEAMDIAHIVYWEIDPASRTFVFNDPFYAFLGTTAEKEGGYRMAIEEYPKRFLPPEELGLVQRLVEQHRAGIDREVFFDVEHRVVRRDGEVRHALLRARVVRDGAGGIIRVYGALQDITERKRAAEELDRVNKRNRLLLESAGEGIFGLDSKGRVTFVNPVAAAALGYGPEELIGASCHDLIHSRRADGTPILEKDCPMNSTLTHGEAHRVANDVFWRKAGTCFPVEYTSTPIIENEVAVGAVVTFRDITEQRELEKRFRQAQRMEAIGTLAGGIAHDFNNILTPIIVHTEMALIDLPKKSPLKLSLEQVLKAGERAKDLVQQILAFSRQTEDKLVVLDIRPIVKEVLKLLRASLPTTIEIRKEIPPEPGSILADPIQIHQVLMNLCTNAAHAMRERGGVLSIGVANDSLDPSSAPGLQDLIPGSYLRLSVGDTGHGMKPEIMEHIFEPYFTTKEKGEGTGLGLAVVHGIATSLGGTIVVHSEPGKGSTFHVYFPIVERKPSAEVQEVAAHPRGTERVLFVDDEKSMIGAVRPMLEHLGYRVTTRTSGVEALELFRADPSRFDLIITDQTMPALTGIELAAEVLKIQPGIPILLCSGFSDLVNEEKAKAIGIRGYIMKPVLMREMATAVRRALDER
ncbi:MAG: PAS domain S-box protein [Thermodesulfobacteriota bacterium]